MIAAGREKLNVEDREASAFGELLRQLRTERSWTQDELAARAGLSVEAIGTLERGVRQRPRLATVRLLARALDLGEANQLFFEATARRATRGSLGGRGSPAAIAAREDLEVRTFLVADIRGHTRFRVEQGRAAAVKLASKFALLTRS